MRPLTFLKTRVHIKRSTSPEKLWQYLRVSGCNNHEILEHTANWVRFSKKFGHRNNNFIKERYRSLIPGSVVGVVLVRRLSYFYNMPKNRYNALQSLRTKIYFGVLLRKHSIGRRHNLTMYCKIARTFFLVRINLNAPNVLAFFTKKKKKAAKHSSFFFKYRDHYARRVRSKAYGSYNKR